MCIHFSLAFGRLIAMPKRIAVFEMDAGFRPIFFVIVSKSIVFAISIRARSDAIDWP
jgi:hypothetical protein